jgi:hypothetical protein
MFAYRATRPADLARCPDPVGELNDEFIRQAVTEPGRMVIAARGGAGVMFAIRRMLRYTPYTRAVGQIVGLRVAR